MRRRRNIYASAVLTNSENKQAIIEAETAETVITGGSAVFGLVLSGTEDELGSISKVEFKSGLSGLAE